MNRRAIVSRAITAQRPKKPLGQAPAPRRPSPTPWDSSYEQAVSGAQRNYLNTTANLNLAEQTAQQDYGLAPGFNDYQSNPYSRAAALEQSYKTANRATITTAGNQLYAGSTSNALNANRSTYGAGRDALEKSYRDALGEINQGRTKAAEERAETEQGAYWDRVRNAESTKPEALTAPRKFRRPPKRFAVRR